MDRLFSVLENLIDIMSDDSVYRYIVSVIKGILSKYNKKTNSKEEWFEYLAEKYDIYPDLLKALFWTESRWDNCAVSPSGAVGISQILPSVWSKESSREWYISVLGVGPYNVQRGKEDWEYNSEYGARILKYYIKTYGTIPKGYAKLNAGVYSYNNGNPYTVSDREDYDQIVYKFMESKPWKDA